MANYVPSALTIYQAKLMQMFQEGALKSTNPEVFKYLLGQSPTIFPEVARTREDRTLTAYYLKRAKRALGTGRSDSHTGTQGDSATVTPSWTTYSDVLAISLKQGDNNLYSYDEMFMNDILNSFKNFEEGLESTAASYVFAQRSGINIGKFDAGVKMNHTTDVMEIADDGNSTLGKFHNLAPSIAETVMKQNKWSGGKTYICDSVAYTKFRGMAAQGAANSTNLSFQFGSDTYINSLDLYALFSGVKNTYVLGSWLVIPNGTIAALLSIPKQNKQGIQTSVNKYGTIVNPTLGLTLATHEYEARANGTATGGYTQDVRKQVELSLDVAFEHAPLDTANESPIMAFAIVDTLAS
jgi:hypothetical protein